MTGVMCRRGGAVGSEQVAEPWLCHNQHDVWLLQRGGKGFMYGT